MQGHVESLRAWLQRDEEAGEGQSLSVIQSFICLTQQILSVPHSRCWARLTVDRQGLCPMALTERSRRARMMAGSGM